MTLPQISIDEIVPRDIQAKVIERNHVNGNVSEHELEVISRIVAYFKPRTIFEIGTFDGRTTINVALNSPSDAKVYTLDLPASQVTSAKYPFAVVDGYADMTYIQKSESGTRYKNKEESEKIVQLYGDSATFNYSPYKEGIDFVFVDGSHSRKYTENDTEVALSMLSPNGIVLWHDYGGLWPDVTNVLDEYANKNERCVSLKHIKGTTLAILKK